MTLKEQLEGQMARVDPDGIPPVQRCAYALVRAITDADDPVRRDVANATIELADALVVYHGNDVPL